MPRESLQIAPISDKSSMITKKRAIDMGATNPTSCFGQEQDLTQYDSVTIFPCTNHDVFTLLVKLVKSPIDDSP
jgi:hypothetical protein